MASVRVCARQAEELDAGEEVNAGGRQAPFVPHHHHHHHRQKIQLYQLD